MTKLALVLSGGGMGGAAHLGAIKALEEFNLVPEAVLGSSIGAFVGSVYASGATPDQMIAGWKAISTMDPSEVLDLDLKSLGNALSSFQHRHITGLILGRVLTRILTDNYIHVRTFAELAQMPPNERQVKGVKEFYVSATNLMDGRETIFCDTTHIPVNDEGLSHGRRLCHCTSFIDAVRASFSLPAIFVPHKIPFPENDCPCKRGASPENPPHHLYIDGAIKDDYPITIAAKIAQADKIIGINLSKAGNKVDLVLNGGLPEIQLRVTEIIGEDQYEADRDDKDVSQVDLLTIDPAIGDVGVFEMDKGDWLIERGYDAVTQCLTQRGLQKGDNREQNLAKLFPPEWLHTCRECGQDLPEATDIGTHWHFVPELPPPAKTKRPMVATSPMIERILNWERWGWLVAAISVITLFGLGGFQFWWVYQLSERAGRDAVVFFGGGFIYVLTVLLGAGLIGSWLSFLLRHLMRRLGRS